MRTEPMIRPLNPRIVNDACTGIWSAASFYAYPILGRPERDSVHEVSGAIWRERSKWLDQNRAGTLFADRLQVLNVMKSQQQRWGWDDSVHPAQFDKASAEETLFVVGGQQANLFAGPMLMVYKAVTLIRAARKAEKELKRSVVPIFWLASEDHDWDEVNHLYVMNEKHASTKVTITGVAEGKPVRDVFCTAEEWQQVIAQIRSLMPETEFQSGWVAQFEQVIRNGASLADVTAKLLTIWFASEGLLLIDAHDPALRQLEVPMFEALIEQNDRLRERLLKSEVDLRMQGYQSGVLWEKNCTHLFAVVDGRRRLLFTNGPDGVQDKKGERHWTWEGLRQQLRQNPETFSNNVLSRPLMQEYLFPVLAAVLGPAELAYWSVLGSAFELFGMQQPVLVCRRSYHIIEGPVDNGLEKHGMSAEQLMEQGERRKQMWLEENADATMLGAISSFQHDVQTAYLKLERKLQTKLGDLDHLIDLNKEKVMEQVAYLTRRMEQHQHRMLEAGIRQWDRMLQSLMPLGKPQERVHHPVVYMNKYGVVWFREWIQMLIEEENE
jgi:bacillithiol biosynthesis cysteine-adding enzyme BshC